MVLFFFEMAIYKNKLNIKNSKLPALTLF